MINGEGTGQTARDEWVEEKKSEWVEGNSGNRASEQQNRKAR